jgi:hypothetical protein
MILASQTNLIHHRRKAGGVCGDSLWLRQLNEIKIYYIAKLAESAKM